MSKNKYTVIVVYPLRLQDQHGLCTYVALVETSTVQAAKALGQKEAMTRQMNEDRGRLVEWKVALVLNGHADIAWTPP